MLNQLISKFRKLFLSLRQVNDLTTEKGRAEERHRRVILSAIASAIAKILSVSAALISVPLSLNYLGVERYGMWMTLSSLIAMLSFADLGVGNGILSRVATAHGKDDQEGLRKIISSGFLILTLIAVIIVFLFGIIYPLVSWSAVFNVETEMARDESGPAIAVFMAIFAINMPLGIVQRIQAGLQQSFYSSLWQCAGSVLSLIGILLAIGLKLSLPWLVIALAGSPLLAVMANNIYFFGRQRPDLIPDVENLSKAMMAKIFKTGSLYFFLQIVMAVAYLSDNLIIAQILGAKAVAAYAVPEKLFSLVIVAIAMVLSPLWPAYGEAIAKGDASWVLGTLKKSLLTSVGFAFVVSAMMAFFAPYIIKIWVGDNITPELWLLLGLACWKTIEAGGGSLSVFLNGTNVVGLQIVLSSLTAISAFALKVFLVTNFGISALPWAMSLAYLLFMIFPCFYFLPKIINKHVFKHGAVD